MAANANAVVQPQPIAAYNEFRAQIAQLESENKALVFEYATPKGNKDARSHVHKLRRSKSAIDAARKAEKQEALDYGRRVDSEAKELIGRVEDMIAVHSEPMREIEEREKARVARLSDALHAITDAGSHALENWQALTLDSMRESIEVIEANYLTEQWAEYADGAERARDKSVSQIREAIGKRETYDAEQAELARLRKEQADREAKEAAELAERERKEREELIARDAAEKAEKAAQAKLEAEKRRAEEAEQAAREADERAKRAAEEAAEQERKAQAERERLAREELERREADKRHRHSVHQTAADALIDGGVSKAVASKVVDLIASGAIPHVSVNY